jgi:hypothetical protein
VLDRNKFVIKEKVKIFSAIQSYDILDAETGELIGVAQEKIGPITQVLRWFMSKQLLPARLEVREKPDDSLVFSLRRGWYIFRSRVEVLDSQDHLIGYFKSKFFTISGGFHVYDKDDKHFAEVRGKLIGWNYRFLSPDGKVQMGQVTKKLGMMGVLKEEARHDGRAQGDVHICRHVWRGSERGAFRGTNGEDADPGSDSGDRSDLQV